MGRIGITFCPGKKQPRAMTGAWDRDLGVDLDAVRAWGASAVVTLVEAHELEALGVNNLGQEVVGRHMDWLHLPIEDVSVPGPDFEAAWVRVGEGLRARIRDGFDVVAHCKGGLGRAGTIAARLLIELGVTPNVAISLVRDARPGAIETYGQEGYVQRLKPVREMAPEQGDVAVRDRAVGALVGLAVGDAVGTTLEFARRDSKPLLTDMVGGGPFKLKAGEWTDDTAMALALADSLIEHPEFDATDLMNRFVSWHELGTYSCTGTCFDIGVTTRQALARYQRSGNPLAGSTDPMSAGNGSLMRLAPVAVRHFRDRAMLRGVAAEQSRTTHAAPQAVDACIAYADILADAIEGQPRSEVMRRRDVTLDPVIAGIVRGSWRGKARDEIKSSGYVAHSLEAAFWCVGRTGDFRSAVLTAANLGDDADTTAAIAGQLAGALYGPSGIPQDWLAKLAWAPRITTMAEALLACA
ncbi:ADP-ribosylglycohydrolase family protein [Sphingomonas jatrophae]|nr:ADP-ribosylglycohydrolase family protein [Sphingomonas jatrophae]